MSQFLDLTGEKFGYLEVLERDLSQPYKRVHWICKCKCGASTSVASTQLTSGRTISCGCRRYETKNQTHGMKHTRIYETWCSMKARCYSPKKKGYAHYGGRGIKVCDEWKTSFDNFYNWAMCNGYDDALTIDRIDVNGDYCPENCRWISRSEQQRNKTNSVLIEHNGETRTLSEWCRYMDEPYQKIHRRMKSTIRHMGRFAFEDLFSPQKTVPLYTERYFGRRNHITPVLQYTVDGVFLKKWDSIIETKESGFNPNAVVACCNGRTKTSGGYIWKYDKPR